MAALETAEILLAEAGTNLDLFLGKVFLAAQTRKISADQLPHVHAERISFTYSNVMYYSMYN